MTTAFIRSLPLAFALLASSVSTEDKPDLSNHNQKINYAFGMDIVSTFKQQDVDIDQKAFIAGMKDALAGKPALTPEQQKTALKECSDEFAAKAQAKRKILAGENLMAGQAFLAANAKKEGVKIMEALALDGSKADMQYEILKIGSGPSPKSSDTVEVHYTGTFIDGLVFDSSVRRGTPATFGMNDIIPGWVAALQQMKAGDKWRLYIPAKLAYGEFGLPQIGPNSTLIYELELLSFYTPATNTPPTPAK
jgi:FKBP-type peptidyl-prolyl cis-trans isomerase FklB